MKDAAPIPSCTGSRSSHDPYTNEPNPPQAGRLSARQVWMMIVAPTLAWALHSASPAATPPPCLSTTQDLFKANNYSAAALAADRCWASTGERDALLVAVLSYRRLNECARVLVLTRRLLALRDVPATARAKIKELGEGCRQQSVEVHVRYTPAQTGPEAVLHAELLSSKNEDLVIYLAVAEGQPGDRRVHLDPGKWHLRLERDDDVQVQGVDLTDATGSAEIAFPDPPAEVADEVEVPMPHVPMTDERARRRVSPETTLGLATLVPSVTLLASGAALTGVGVGEYRDGLRNLEKQTDPTTNGKKAFQGIMQSTQGMAMLGTSLGAGAVAITDFAGADERALLAETAAGGAVSLGGLAWWLTATMSYESDVKELRPEHFSDVYPKELVASALFGIGTGMAISAAVSLLVTKLRKRQGRSGQVARRSKR